jgi:hypothetical protein
MQEPLLRAVWWLVPLVVLAAAVLFMAWLKHRRIKDTLELMRAYLAQGKDPPADLVRSLHDQEAGLGRMNAAWWTSARQAWQGAIIFGSLAVGFALWGIVEPGAWPGHRNGPLSTAVLLGAAALASLLSALFWHRLDDK